MIREITGLCRYPVGLTSGCHKKKKKQSPWIALRVSRLRSWQRLSPVEAALSDGWSRFGRPIRDSRWAQTVLSNLEGTQGARR